jgi:tetratricopeptide (TPR) repeat protein
MEESVQVQMRGRFESLKKNIERSDTPASELGAAYGETGKLLFAAEQVEAAEACFLNAQALVPDNRRWPYYLGHLYRIRGPLDRAAASFERALQLNPGDAATRVWLGEVYLAQGRAEEAEPLFADVLAREPQSVPAHFGAGRAALAKKAHAAAVRHLEQALVLEPKATASHYPLAMAYRRLGDPEKAEAHLRLQGDVRILPTDPLMKELDELLQSPRAYDLRGGQALETGDWASAVAYFRKGLELAPDNPALRLRLGTALFQMGDARGALEQFEQVVRTTPQYARAHYSLGVLMEASGRRKEAIDRFSTALKYEPAYIQARVGLAGAFRQSGRLDESLAEYERALDIDQNFPGAIAGYAMTLVGLRRYQQARDTLADGMRRHPDDLVFPRALARLLSAAPDDRVRDGRRALSIVQELLKKEQSLEAGETLAMALAESGDYQKAAAVQRDVIAAAQGAGLADAARRMAENLTLYERRQPCRTPWRDGEMP